MSAIQWHNRRSENFEVFNLYSRTRRVYGYYLVRPIFGAAVPPARFASFPSSQTAATLSDEKSILVTATRCSNYKSLSTGTLGEQPSFRNVRAEIP